MTELDCVGSDAAHRDAGSLESAHTMTTTTTTMMRTFSHDDDYGNRRCDGGCDYDEMDSILMNDELASIDHYAGGDDEDEDDDAYDENRPGDERHHGMDNDKHDDDDNDEEEPFFLNGDIPRPKQQRKRWKCARNKDAEEASLQSPTDRRRQRRRQMLVRCIMTPIIMFVSVWIGAVTQRIKTQRIPDTVSLYQTGHVCAVEYPQQLMQQLERQQHQEMPLHAANTTENHVLGGGVSGGTSEQALEFQYATPLEPIAHLNLDSPEQANAAQNLTVAHCGDCGYCSNPHDIKIYDDTKDTLFQDSLACSKLAVLGGADDVRDCLQDRIGFTQGCNDCWVDNIMCDVRNCLFVCMWQAMFSTVDADKNTKSDRTQQDLNACTQCDEKRCGPAFVQCAGANRRRSGIVSEFKRDDRDEVCHSVQVGWWQNEAVQQYYRQQQAEEEDGLV
mmetsp:Transcript_4699/g.12288  ORF Transcript_4699/g.12288 Transcript_4699/m.12288 type:complete len:446 (-) Transcript_4699:148-1485(-)|eukprot:CAMPEP_0198114498 /NCGR_PEP_ID=MMETSP1442-20131203/5868_1 /TAXON_ID= /ORGANISM="Craspedostauros australis, Strain CCMP3328" /LENGTH=445 /DNA_ID=CAMNT_0043771817 /DNA_START=226 /DNA_END=1563 /DNA_ORIENTATION=-